MLFLFYFCLDDNKIDQILQETKRNQQMSNQIASRTFITNAFEEGTLPVGQEVSGTFFLLSKEELRMIIESRLKSPLKVNL